MWARGCRAAPRLLRAPGPDSGVGDVVRAVLEQVHEPAKGRRQESPKSRLGPSGPEGPGTGPGTGPGGARGPGLSGPSSVPPFTDVDTPRSPPFARRPGRLPALLRAGVCSAASEWCQAAPSRGLQALSRAAPEALAGPARGGLESLGDSRL